MDVATLTIDVRPLIQPLLDRVEAFLAEHGTDPENQQASIYKEHNTLVLTPKGSELPFEEAMAQYPSVYLGIASPST